MADTSIERKMQPKYDLRTAGGVAAAAALLATRGVPLLGFSAVVPIAGPAIALAIYRAYRKRVDESSKGLADTPGVQAATPSSPAVADDQEQVAVSLIKEAQASGAASIEIVVEKKVGANLAAKLPKFMKTELRFSAEKSENTTIHVVFK